MENNLMEKILYTYNVIIEKIDKFNPKVARSVFNKINYIIITVSSYQRLRDKFKLKETKDLNEIYEILVEIDFIDLIDLNFMTEFIQENKNILQDLVNILMQYNSSYNVFDLYENIISNDIVIKDSKYTVIKENKARDRSGAYYTSRQFAKNIVKKSINDYICNKLEINKFELENLLTSKSSIVKELLLESKYSDISCGTGHFIIALIEYLEDILDDEFIHDIILNIYAFDVDFIAIQIIRSELLIKSENLKNAKLIKDKTIVGNTLINSERIDYSKVLELTSQGYIYHPEIGINQNKYENFFDVIIGNPPWEKIRFEDKNFFTNYCPRITNINKKEDRLKEIENLKYSNPNLKDYYDSFNLKMDISKKLIKSNQIFKNSASGELNTYNLFTELSVNFLKEKGCIALIVKSSLITSSANSKIFKFLVEENLIKAIYDFINKKKIFPIDSRERFSVLFLQKYFYGDFDLKMMLEEIDAINYIENTIKLNKEILQQINPSTQMIPNISSSKELKLLIKFYKQFNIFEQEFNNCKFGRLVHLTNHTNWIYKEKKDNTEAIYEGKFIEIYDNKFSTFKDLSHEKKYASKANAREMSEIEKNDILNIPESRFFIDKDKWQEISKNYDCQYSLYWRALTKACNRRTTIATILPHIPTIQSLQLLQCNDNKELLIILSLFNSAIFDYLVRLKLNGIDLTPTIIKQIPVPNKTVFKNKIIFNGEKNSIENHIFIRIEALYKNDYRNNNIFKSIKLPKTKVESNISKKEIILQIDYLISKAYDIEIEELIQILSTFPKYYTKEDLEYIRKLK